MAEEGVSILETESYTLAIVFLVFLALFVTVEKVRFAVLFVLRVVPHPTAKVLAVAEMATSQLDTATQSWPAGTHQTASPRVKWLTPLTLCESTGCSGCCQIRAYAFWRSKSAAQCA